MNTREELDNLTAELTEWNFAEPTKPLLRIVVNTTGITGT